MEDCGGPRCDSKATSRRSSGVGSLGRRRISSSSGPALGWCVRFDPKKPSGSAPASNGPLRGILPVDCFCFLGLPPVSLPPNKSCNVRISTLSSNRHTETISNIVHNFNTNCCHQKSSEKLIVASELNARNVTGQLRQLGPKVRIRQTNIKHYCVYFTILSQMLGRCPIRF
jgi:hypothetical protein